MREAELKRMLDELMSAKRQLSEIEMQMQDIQTYLSLKIEVVEAVLREELTKTAVANIKAKLSARGAMCE